MNDTCEWPGCKKPALCSSGNLNGGLVCREHFKITNGKTAEKLSESERQIMTAISAAHGSS